MSFKKYNKIHFVSCISILIILSAEFNTGKM